MPEGKDTRAVALGQRVRQHRSDYGLSRDQLADEVNSFLRKSGKSTNLATVTGDLVRKWEDGHVKLFRHRERLEAVASVFNLSSDELLTGEIKSPQEEKRMRRIPVLGDLAAGSPEGAYGVVEWIEVEDWGNVFERYGRRIRGVSMEPALYQNDLCIFETRTPEGGEVVHAEHEESRCDTIKVLSRRDGRNVLVPRNPDSEAVAELEWTLKGTLVEVERDMGNGLLIRIRDKWGGPLRPDFLEKFPRHI